MKNIITICLLLVGILGSNAMLKAQNDTTDDTWRITGDNTITDSTTIITNRLGIGNANHTYEEGLHLIDKAIYLQRTNSPMWRIASSYGTGTFWIRNETGNVNAFRLEANGRLGLGTGASLSPQAQLHVRGYNHKALLVQGGPSQGTQPIFQTINNEEEPIFSIFDNQKIGINTTSPTASLDISALSDSIVQNYSGLKVAGEFEKSAAQIINNYSGINAGGLSIETADNNAQGDALSVKTNRNNSQKIMFRIPNYSTENSAVIMVEDGGNVGIGTTNPEKKLDVCGHIRAKEVVIESGWCDYVFYENYDLPTLQEQADFIEENGHLKNFESAQSMENTIEVADVTTRQQQTLEEMMLYLIEMEKKMTHFQSENQELQNRIKVLEKELAHQK